MVVQIISSVQWSEQAEKHNQHQKLGNKQLGLASMDLSTFSPHTTHSGLVSIALVIRSKDGPRFVFHYPSHPPFLPPEQDSRYGTELDDEEIPEDNDEEDEDSDLEDGGVQFHSSFGKLGLNDHERTHSKKHYHANFEDNHIELPNGEQVVPWEHMGEFETTDLESILTPSRAYHKKKFVLDLDPLLFVSYPIHIREDGAWKKRPRKKLRKKSKPGGDENSEQGEKKQNEDKGKAADSDDGGEHGGMTMFNVVFALNVPADEQDDRVQEMYDHVIRKFNKALSHSQASSDYVWKESELILSMKEKAREKRTFYL